MTPLLWNAPGESALFFEVAARHKLYKLLLLDDFSTSPMDLYNDSLHISAQFNSRHSGDVAGDFGPRRAAKRSRLASDFAPRFRV